MCAHNAHVPLSIVRTTIFPRALTRSRRRANREVELTESVDVELILDSRRILAIAIGAPGREENGSIGMNTCRKRSRR